jgi:outer membrane protein, multidrug efflux system
VYQDPVLTQLIHTAIMQNYDVRIAATRVLEAQAQVGVTRANQLPSASVAAEVFSQQNAKVSKLFPAYEVNGGELNLSVIWNLDFWGKVPKANRGGSCPVTRHRVGAASGTLFAGR